MSPVDQILMSLDNKERPEGMARSYRPFRCLGCANQLNERSSSLPNRTQYAPAEEKSPSRKGARGTGQFQVWVYPYGKGHLSLPGRPIRALIQVNSSVRGRAEIACPNSRAQRGTMPGTRPAITMVGALRRGVIRMGGCITRARRRLRCGGPRHYRPSDTGASPPPRRCYGQRLHPARPTGSVAARHC